MSVQITFNKKTFAINTLPYSLRGLKTEILRDQYIPTTNFDIKASYLNKSRKPESALISTETQYQAFLKKASGQSDPAFYRGCTGIYLSGEEKYHHHRRREDSHCLLRRFQKNWWLQWNERRRSAVQGSTEDPSEEFSAPVPEEDPWAAMYKRLLSVSKEDMSV